MHARITERPGLARLSCACQAEPSISCNLDPELLWDLQTAAVMQLRERLRSIDEQRPVISLSELAEVCIET